MPKNKISIVQLCEINRKSKTSQGFDSTLLSDLKSLQNYLKNFFIWCYFCKLSFLEKKKQQKKHFYIRNQILHDFAILNDFVFNDDIIFDLWIFIFRKFKFSFKISLPVMHSKLQMNKKNQEEIQKLISYKIQFDPSRLNCAWMNPFRNFYVCSKWLEEKTKMWMLKRYETIGS